MDIKPQICRLCLQKFESRCEVLKDVTKNALSTLSLNLDLSISDEPVICNNCITTLEEAVSFKVSCLQNKNLTLVIPKDPNLNEPEMHIVKSEVDATVAVVNNGECCFCMEEINQDASVILRNDENGVTKTLEKFFPELVSTTTMGSTMCVSCYRSLQKHLNFIDSCLMIEEMIKEYCIAEGANIKHQVELSDVVHYYTLENQNVAHADLHTVKEEDCWKSVDPLEAKNEVFIKLEKQQLDCDNVEDFDVKAEQNVIDRFDTPQRKLEDGTQSHLFSVHSAPEVTVFKCGKCNYSSKQEHLMFRHTRSHERSALMLIYNCTHCDFQTKHKNSLQRHVKKHKDSLETVYKCGKCDFQSNREHLLFRHMPVHGQLPYKCEMCLYQTKLKANLHRHMLIHKSTEEVTMYKCAHCNFQTRHKESLPTHVLGHKHLSEVVRYKCKTCTYQTRYKTNMRKHVEAHETTGHKCKLCGFKPKNFKSMRVHMRIHDNGGKLRLFVCETCGHRTGSAGNHKAHMLSHKSPSEVPMYKCATCDFQTRHKKNLPLHFRIHTRPPPVIKMHKCTKCEYQSRCKKAVAVHLLTHDNPSEVAYKCYMCPYGSKFKKNLSRHMLVHKAPQK